MITYRLKFTLRSEATFGRGDGLAGLVDMEIQHDAYGLPYLGGRTLRGLLNYECADILFALGLQNNKKGDWEQAAHRLFGQPGSKYDDMAIMRVGNACLPDELKQAVKAAIEREKDKVTKAEVLEALTVIRRQTAIDEVSGAPQKNSLRSMRLILPETPFEAELLFVEDPQPKELALLAACVKALRRAGSGRNRGRGELAACLYDDQGENVTDRCFKLFQKEVEA